MIDTLVRACYLYQFYDEDDALLYVGITDNVVARFRVHRRESQWWTNAVRCEWQVYGSRAAAAAAEAAAIRVERPAHNRSLPPLMSMGKSDAEVTKADLLRAPDEVERFKSESHRFRLRSVIAEGENQRIIDAADSAHRMVASARSEIRSLSAQVARVRYGRGAVG